MVGTLAAQEGTAARAPMAAPEIAMTCCLASFLTCSIIWSTSMPARVSATRAASNAAIAASAQPTTAAISESIAPSVVAQASKHAAAWPTWAPTTPTFMKYCIHELEMTSARAPCP
ncbi:hypothetical protein DVS77_27195 [Mycolicibacterium moriokaense]|nr:hypothetical protein DVS77_27195 [Mycolicibacterium moriokaense]